MATLAIALACSFAAPSTVASESGGGGLARFDSGPIADREQAQQALDEVARARAASESGHAQRTSACYGRTLVSACLEDAEKDRRLSEQRYRRIESGARTFLREQRALESARGQADAIEARETGAASRGEEPGRNERDRAQRERDHRERETARTSTDDERTAKAAAHARRSRERQAEIERRRAESERRDELAPARAAAHAKRLEEHAREQRERESRSKRER